MLFRSDGMELYGTDMISMGNRYTVRGFDGEVTLMGTDGWYLRNEFATRFPKQKLELYLGFDVGAVYGAGADLYNGHTIVGTAFGVRGMINDLSYDVFAAMPIRKPDGFHTAKVTGGSLSDGDFKRFFHSHPLTKFFAAKSAKTPSKTLRTI